MKSKELVPIRIIERESQFWATSIEVAKNFGKNHKNVLRAIENLECPFEFSRLNFEPREYLDERGKLYPMYEISRDGFAILVMGFTGKKAMEWKVKYITAFNAMEQALRNLAAQEVERIKTENRHLKDPEQIQARLEGKVSRNWLMDSVKRIKELADSQNPDNSAERYYVLFTRMIYDVLFNLKKIPKDLRDSLPAMALRKLDIAEYQAAQWINEFVDQRIDYHQPYPKVKERMVALVEVIGAIDLTVPVLN